MRIYVIQSNGGGWFHRLYMGKNLGRASALVRQYRSAGWTEPFPLPGSVGIIKARTWQSALAVASNRLDTAQENSE